MAWKTETKAAREKTAASMGLEILYQGPGNIVVVRHKKCGHETIIYDNSLANPVRRLKCLMCYELKKQSDAKHFLAMGAE